MENSKIVQRLLRPTDTCVIVVQGYFLGLSPPSPRLIAVVKHEGTAEHALFIFETDKHTNPVSEKVENFYPIKGTFNLEVKDMHPSQCQVLVNNGAGSSIALQLASDSHTAVFISQIKKAFDHYIQSPAANSPSSFSWLRGYEFCRTGWDRFSKPYSQLPMNSDPPQLAGGFPDSWPWSHIITPNSDGTTEIARCELLENFDPLMQSNSSQTSSPSPNPSPNPPPSHHQPPSHVQPTNLSRVREVSVKVTNSSPGSTPKLHNKGSPFHSPEGKNPFLSSAPHASSQEDLVDSVDPRLKHCISDTNLNKLKQEYKPMHPDGLMESLVTRSTEDLTATTADDLSPRHCIANERRHQVSPKQSPRLSRKNHHARKNHHDDDDERLSKSLFFVPLNDWEIFTEEDESDLHRARSTDSSPTQESKNSKYGSKHKLEFLNPSGIKAITSKANSRSPDLRHIRKGLGRSRDRSKSAAVAQGHSVGKRSKWVSRYRPGVAVPIQGETARESIMQSELRHRENEFCSQLNIRVFCVTWNVNGRVPPSSLDPLLGDFFIKGETKGEAESLVPDIFAIGFQELDLSAQCLVSGESNREDMWVDAVEDSLKKVGAYAKLCCVRLVGIMLLVYIKQSFKPHISDVETDQVPTGMHGIMGNKGGVGVHFNLYHSSLCFVNTHLSAHMEEVEKRNAEFAHIMNKMTFPTNDFPYDIVHHDMIFWLGDLNYRIVTSSEMTCEQVKAHADAYQFPALLRLDQLINEMRKNNVFVGFKEADIDFKPSYKYDPNTDNWDSSEKHRAPAWCDRILYRGNNMTLCSYRSHPSLLISDHKPVSAIMDVALRQVDPLKEKVVLEQITWRLDKLENDTLPQVDLNVTEFRFKNVDFLVPQSRRLVVTNTGQSLVHISFIPKLDDKSLTKDWLTVKPTSAVIHPLEDAVVEFTVLVDEDSAPPLTSGKDILEDILVLHLEKGKDFFISVSGNYLPSCFGSSLETLVNLHTYIREVPVAKLVDLTSSWEECVLEPRPNTDQAPPPLDIPKELFAMVDFIQRNGIDKEGLFSDGGRKAELDEIRNMLDTGGRDLPGSVFSVASVLLTFLASLAEPVVPVNLHSRCMEGCNNTTLCKQILSQMPAVHRKTFIFLVKFMKDLIKSSEINGLDPKVLATIFGEVLLRTPLRERKSKSRRQLTSMNRRKATFLYQFIVNDLTAPVSR